MDRYKFRGKRLDNGEFEVGYYYKRYSLSLGEIHYISNGTGEHRIDPSTVGQYTGLPDKNGKEIYEGDIVKFTFDDEDSCMGNTYDEIYIVEWNNRYLQIEFSDNKYHPLGTHQGKYNLHSLSHMSYEIEVISNIHDNPSLLKGE